MPGFSIEMRPENLKQHRFRGQGTDLHLQGKVVVVIGGHTHLARSV
ncbi:MULTISPECIES: hypothetical protein [Paracoccus]|jgi:hypothetical protein|nr:MULTISPECIES: hypothetical protein [Paracoccus]MDK8873829.1 hypothetical protein [Paracoccus sp. SSJ]UFS68021.1 hypothetical protein LO749_23860 [Paracoccus denitrificans]